MTTTGGDDINLAPENNHDDDTVGGDNVDLDGHDDGSGDTTAQANVIPAQGGGGNGPTNFNLRVEQNKYNKTSFLVQIKFITEDSK